MYYMQYLSSQSSLLALYGPKSLPTKLQRNSSSLSVDQSGPKIMLYWRKIVPVRENDGLLVFPYSSNVLY